MLGYKVIGIGEMEEENVDKRKPWESALTFRLRKKEEEPSKETEWEKPRRL